jgi:CubicO group peptidase (beta-lactamase class C family)
MVLDAHGLDALVTEAGFSGVVRVDRAGDVVLARGYGLADRANEVSNEPGTRFAVASGVKGMTALTVMSLVEEGVLELATTARSLLGDDLPLIADDVTVEHLLAHRSGIGDYLDEEVDHDITDYPMPVPVHELAETEQYLAVLDGHPTKFRADERFAYCNGGFVVLALIAERASGTSFHELVAERVCRRAGMGDTDFLRSDELPPGAARGYLAAQGLRTNVLHLPVRGTGDGGIYTTAADMRAFWTALFAGRIVSKETVAEMVRPRSETSDASERYGLGFWLRTGRDTVALEGYDAGVSFRSLHDPGSDTTSTVLSNWTDGAWPVTKYLEGELGL